MTVGNIVALSSDEEGAEAEESEGDELRTSTLPLGLEQAMWQTPDGKRQLQLRVVFRGGATVLGDAASENELFLTEDLLLRSIVRHLGERQTWDFGPGRKSFTNSTRAVSWLICFGGHVIHP